jgi:hypothetical protein
MLKHIALIVVLAWQFDPSYVVEDRRGGPCKVTCLNEAVPPGFSCAILYKIDPPVPEGVASIVGRDYDTIRGVTVILDQTFYTAVFDPPLKPDDRFPTLRQGEDGIAARVEGDDLFVRWSVGKEAQAKIIRRETMKSNRPQRA